MHTPIDPTLAAAQSSAQAAWAAVGIARAQLWATWAAVAGNVGVLMSLAVMNSNERRKAAQARLLSATITLGHALALVLGIFDRLGQMPPGDQLPAALMDSDVTAIQRCLDAVPADLADSDLAFIRNNISTMAESIRSRAQLPAGRAIDGFLVECGPYAEVAQRLIQQLDVRLRALSGG